MMIIMLVMKNVDLDLAIAMTQFAPSVIVYGKIIRRKEIGYYAIFVRNISAQYGYQKLPILKETFIVKTVPSEVSL